MNVYKVVRESDLGPSYLNEKAAAFREPGTLVWGNLYQPILASSKKPFHVGGHFAYAESISDAIEMAKEWDDRHEKSIRRFMAFCAQYGRYLSYKKAKSEYMKHDGILTDREWTFNALSRVLRAMLHQEIWYQYSKTLRIGSEERYEAGEETYSWQGVVGRMTFGHVYNVPRSLATFVEKLPLLKGYDFSPDNPLFEERTRTR